MYGPFFETPHGPLRVGAIVSQALPGGERRKVLIDELCDNVKDGRPGFRGSIPGIRSPYLKLKNGDMRVWGYTEDVVSIEAVH